MLETFNAKRREVTAAIAEVVTLGTRIGARTIAAKLEEDVIKKLEQDRFNLVVVGEFNHGKTTFVNALVGKQLLPAGVTPTTAVIHHLEYAEDASASVVTESGERRSLPMEDVRSYAVGGGTDGAAVKYLEIFTPSDILKQRIVLVDTPGVNDLSHQRADITYSYIPKSDAVLFLLDAGQPLKESERVFLQERLLAASKNKIIFVVTKRDIWDAEEEKEALAYIRREVDKLVPNAPVFAVSAERALSGKDGSGMPELLTYLAQFLAEERGRILLGNALTHALSVGELLGKGVDAKRRAAEMSIEELTRRLSTLEKDLEQGARTLEQRRAFLREEVAAIKAWVKRDLEHFVVDVEKQLPSVIDNAKTDEIKLHLGPFLERTIVEWVTKETKEIGAALELLAEKTVALVRDDANDNAKRLSDAFGSELKAPEVKVDAITHHIGVTALLVVGIGVAFTNVLLGGGLAVAALPLAWYLRGREDRMTREKAREVAPKAIRETTAKLGPKLEEMIEAFAAKLDAWVVQAGEELHRELIEILKQSKLERQAGALSSEAVVGSCDELRAKLNSVSAGLVSMKESLSASTVAAAAASPEAGSAEVAVAAPTPDPGTPPPSANAPAAEAPAAEPPKDGA